MAWSVLICPAARLFAQAPAAVTSADDFAFVLPHALYAAVVKPRQILEKWPTPAAPLSQWLALRNFALENHDVTRSRVPLLTAVERGLGDVERVVYVALAPMGEDLTTAYGPLIEVYVVRFAAPINRQFVLDVIAPTTALAAGEKQYYGGSDRSSLNPAVWFIDDRTFAFTFQVLLERLLTTPVQPSAFREELMRVSADVDFAGLINTEAVGNLLGRIPAAAADEQSIPWQELLKSLNGNPTATLQFDDACQATVRFPCRDAEAAGRCEEWIGKQSARFSEWLKPLAGDAAAAENAEVLAAAGMQVTRQDANVFVSLPRLTSQDAYGQTLRQCIEKAPESVRRTWQASSRPLADATAAAVRRIAPRELAADIDVLSVIARSSTSPSPVEVAVGRLSPTGLLMVELLPDAETMKLYPKWFDDFRFLSATPPSPAELAEVMLASLHLGYASMLQHHHITDVTATVAADAAEGAISFEVPDRFAGKIQYRAERLGDTWRIVRFEFPGRKWTYDRRPDGDWNWTTAMGDLTAEQFAGVRVHGRCRYQGRPLSDEEITLRHTLYYDVSVIVSTDKEGAFRVDMNLPLGSYHAYVERHRASRTKLPEKFVSAKTSGLTCEIKAGGEPLQIEFTD